MSRIDHNMHWMQNKNLDGSEFSIENKSNTCVILIHGFTATTIEVRPLSEYLASKGYSIYAPLLPGHDTTPSDLNKRNWSEWTNKVEELTIDALRNYKNVFLGGESMGGIISCYVASFHPEISGLLLYSPAIQVKKLGFMRIMKLFTKYISKPSLKLNDEDTDDVLPWKGYKVNPTSAAVQLLRLQEITKLRLHLIRQPTIIFQGNLDRTIDPNGAEYLIGKINSSVKKLIWLEKSGHCVLLDQEYFGVFAETDIFIKQVLSNDFSYRE
ncbi:MAG: hypothetical protein CVU46_05420 [Chloroflexi bacterium HGW-Chloroflexi-8]|nr:MAG: hypothetical protein CVU46_05420 [Chloroflexi bacterium HGW-Chloroflexi-8]